MTAHPAIPLAGVIGNPIGHSLSPVVHGFWLRRYGIRGHYIPMQIASEDLSEVLRALPKAGFVGCNVTIPHKEAVFALADAVTDRAARIGAANTLTFQPDGTIHADNTDGYGFIANLRAGAPLWRADAGPAAVLGAGGAARAIVASLLDAGVPELRIANRTRARAEALQAEFGDRIRVHDWAEVGAMLADVATLVNTSSLGMGGGGDRVPMAALPPDAVVTDCVYTPLITPFLADAAARGCTVVDGLGMLLHQAVPGFERWFGRTPEVMPELRQTVLGQ
ncbi:shikimate dehydrogenase [Paenirhodobacter populi]|uniref:Shikimate dehydrogenase (NADP(+)) n=1 Tax=Paenirhodobacter populi TaxID=2306993 RepID=A0A443INM2_9RHOB|nr:shikimate dehydrogenase [Sinirhodobacter populi]RWR07012.1 shikimate dehydrogenase [Sinirhodobacter populi]